MAANASEPDGDAGDALEITREFDAPRALVFAAWTQREHLMKWSCPKGLVVFLSEGDPRPGGTFRTGMRSPDGVEHVATGTFREVVPQQRLVMTHAWERPGDTTTRPTLITITFEERAGRTTMRFRQSGFETANSRDGHARGWNSAFDKLAALVRDEQQQQQQQETPMSAPCDPPFVITHVVDAPLDVVWRAYTDRDELMKWFGPAGFTMPTATLDFRVGGVFHYCLRAANGTEMWGKWTFHEIAPKTRLVNTVQFSDASGNVTRHPFAPTWPQTTLSTTTFAEANGNTTITIEWRAIDAGDVERATFNGSHDGMRQGMAGTFAQLDAYLAKQR